jgi:hypothetical protein
VLSRIVVDERGGLAKVFTPYDLREIVKTIPGRKWDPVGKCWTVPLPFVPDLADALRAAGSTVHVTKPDGTPWASGRTGEGRRDTPAADWAEQLLRAVGPDRAERVHRALVRVLHPDAEGGSTELMAALNRARDRVAVRGAR